jgi:hypothetical protein
MSCGVFPMLMENKEGPRMDMILQFMGNSGMVRKGERLILIEEGGSTAEINASASLRIITVR